MLLASFGVGEQALANRARRNAQPGPSANLEVLLHMRFGIGMNKDHTLEEVGPTVFGDSRAHQADRDEGTAEAEAPQNCLTGDIRDGATPLLYLCNVRAVVAWTSVPVVGKILIWRSNRENLGMSGGSDPFADFAVLHFQNLNNVFGHNFS
jgi:hypothetical protein